MDNFGKSGILLSINQVSKFSTPFDLFQLHLPQPAVQVLRGHQPLLALRVHIFNQFILAILLRRIEITLFFQVASKMDVYDAELHAVDPAELGKSKRNILPNIFDPYSKLNLHFGQNFVRDARSSVELLVWGLHNQLQTDQIVIFKRGVEVQTQDRNRDDCGPHPIKWF